MRFINLYDILMAILSGLSFYYWRMMFRLIALRWWIYEIFLDIYSLFFYTYSFLPSRSTNRYASYFSLAYSTIYLLFLFYSRIYCILGCFLYVMGGSIDYNTIIASAIDPPKTIIDLFKNYVCCNGHN